MKRLSWLFLILWSLGAAPAEAVDIFVNNVTGSDAADGRAAAGTGGNTGPVRTITRGLRIAGQGDRVVLAKTPNPYRESITLSGRHNSGFSSQPFVILGNGATLDGTEPVPERAWEFFRDDMFRYRPARLAWQMLNRDGQPLPQHPIDRLAPKLPKLRPLEWCLFDGYIYLRVEKNKHPLDYQLTHTALQTGITFYGVENVTVADLVVEGYRFDGAALADRAIDVRLTGVVLRGNGRCGLSVGGASSALVDHCRMGGNGGSQVRVEAPARLKVEQSQVPEGIAPRYQNFSGQLTVDGQPPPAE